MKHEERRLRRREIANAVKSGNLTRQQAALEFGVSLSTVSMACFEHGMPPGVRRQMPRRTRFSVGRTVRIMADLLKGLPQSDVAKRHDVTHQWVSVVAIELKKRGLLKENP